MRRNLSILSKENRLARKRVLDAALHRRERGTLSAEAYAKWVTETDARFDTPGILTAELGSVVPCCPACNYAKRGMDETKFRAWARQLGQNLKQKIIGDSGLVSLLFTKKE